MNIAILDQFSNTCIEKNDLIFYYGQHKENNEILHGDLVYLTLKKYLDNVRCYCYSIFTPTLQRKESSFLFAINHIINNPDIDVVIFCFTPSNTMTFEIIKKNVQEMIRVGKYVIVADSNRNFDEPWKGIKDLIIIKRGAVVSEPFYIKIDDNIYLGDSSPEFVYASQVNKFYLFSGTSKAVPKFVKNVYNGICFGIKNIEELKTYLSNESGNMSANLVYEWNNKNIFLENEFVCKMIVQCINDFYKSKRFLWSKIRQKDIDINVIVKDSREYTELIFFCLNNFLNSPPLDQLVYSDFQSIYSLSNWVNKNCYYNKK